MFEFTSGENLAVLMLAGFSGATLVKEGVLRAWAWTSKRLEARGQSSLSPSKDKTYSKSHSLG